MGLGIGGFANINSMNIPVGFELKVIVGQLNYKRKSKV
jgi:hypothetical protein